MTRPTSLRTHDVAGRPKPRYAHTAAAQSVLFSISDRPAQEALGIWREER